MKTLKTIQKLAKVGKVFCTIIFILSLVGGIGCIVGIIGLAVIPDGLKIGDITIHSIIEKQADISLGTCYTSMAVGVVLCAGEAVLCKIAERYFKNELAAGTPFTLDGAKELMRLGILTICIPIGTIIISGIVYGVMSQIFGGVADYDINNYTSVGLGVMFIVMSLLCRYGAENQNAGNPDIQE
ncbi:MAG: hypothetical protein IJ725_06280 [Ruminococcus sp.]|nr:hypothetical protein [Ruminococcus sp.]